RCDYEQLLDNSMSVILEWPGGANCKTFGRNYWFRCENTCLSKMDGLDIKVVFTFEEISGKVFGRVSIDVWVSNTPIKDLQLDELKVPQMPTKDLEDTTVASSINLNDSTKPEVFVIHVRGKKNFKLLQKVRDAMEEADDVRKAEKPVKRPGRGGSKKKTPASSTITSPNVGTPKEGAPAASKASPLEVPLLPDNDLHRPWEDKKKN
ncbi:unnamed protein product, partial [Owenia fusiformis]